MFDRKEEAQEILKNISDPNGMNNEDRCSLNACRALCWSKYHVRGCKEAVYFIRLALEETPNCPFFHFILGKNLRRIRRDTSYGTKPSDEERRCFITAFENSQNETYGIYVAQMYREAKEDSQALIMYEKILKNSPKFDSTYLRIALGLIRLNALNSADKCLGLVAKRCGNCSMFLHYKGIYHMKSKNFKVRHIF